MDKLIGIGFYREDQWPLLLDTADDINVMEKVYGNWKKGIERLIENVKTEGIEPVVLDIDIYELLAYCTEHGLRNNGEARSKFVAELLRNRLNEKAGSNVPGDGWGKLPRAFHTGELTSR